MPVSPPTATTAPQLPGAALPLRARLWRWSRRIALGLLSLCLIATAAAWMLLQWWLLPRVNQWRPQIEARAMLAVGVPVQIAAIDAGPGYWSRAITLRDVVLRDERGEEALRLRQVQVVLSPASLLPRSLTHWTPRFDEITVDQPKLDARRTRDGHILVAGLHVGGRPGGSAEGGSPLADWLFSQGKVVVRSGALTWVDETRQAPILELRAVDIEVRNGLHGHQVRIAATPPDSWGGRFSLQGDFRQPLIAGGQLVREGDWQQWRGTLQADLPSMDARELRHHVDLPFDLEEGRGKLQLTASINAGRVETASADVALQDVQIKLGAQLDPLRVKELSTQLEARLAPVDTAGAAIGARERMEITAHSLAFSTSDGVVWPAGDLFVAMLRNADGTLVGGEAQAQHLDLAVLARLARQVPLAGPLRRIVEQSQPRGVIEPLKLTWSGPLDAPQRYNLSGRASALQLQGVPAVVGAAGPTDPASAPLATAAAAASAAASMPASVSPTLAAATSASAAAPLVGPPPDIAIQVPLGRPGLRNATVEFTATQEGGQAHVLVERGALELPGVFADAVVPLERLDAQVNWRVGARTSGPDAPPAPLEVQVREARFTNADAQGEFKGTWRSGKPVGPAHEGYLPGEIDLDAQLSRASVARVARYLPLSLSAGVRQYVAGAAVGGTARGVTARVRGELARFPFAGGSDGEFKVRALVEDGTLVYVPASGAQQASQWPVFTQVRGELAFDRLGMEIRNAQGRISGAGSGQFQLSAVNGGIKDFAHEPALHVDGSGRGPLNDALQFLEVSPLGGWIGHPLAKARGQGDASLRLALHLPLNDLKATTVNGHLQLAGNELRLLPAAPALSNVRGRVEFSEHGFALRDTTARVLGGDARVAGGMRDDGSVRIDGDGNATAEALRAAAELGPLVTQLARYTHGSAPFKVELLVARGGTPELRIRSPLTGLSSVLPAPFDKTAAQPLPLLVELTAPATAAETEGRNASADQIRVELGSLLHAQVQRDTSGAQARIVRGGISVGGDPAPAPERGLEVAVNLPNASLDAWRTWADSAAAARGPADAASNATGAMPERITVRARELTAFSRKLSAVTAVVTRPPSERDGVVPWRVQIEADQLSGRIEYRAAPPGAAGATAQEGRVFARLSRLSLPQSDATAVESLLDQTTTVPSLDVVVDDFELRGKKLGRLEIAAANRGGSDGAPREWQLAKFNLTTREAQLTASGNWTAVNVVADPATRLSARRRTALAFQLNLSDAGATLARTGLPGVLRGGKGQLSGDISWFGSPLSPDYASLSGSVKVALDAGQFLKAEPGAARLLGVLSLQALPRRLLLDFRDVFQEGFSFDNMAGDATIAQGIAATRNLRIRGVQAVVLMEGSADIIRETQDLHVWVVPEINAGTASLAYAIVNPALGLGTFLGQLFLRKPLIEANTREFRINGAWTDPKVERMERTRGAPESGASDAASGPAGG